MDAMTAPTEGPIDRLRTAAARVRELAASRPRTGLSHEDADDDAGTAATDAALHFDPIALLRALSDAKARVAVIGQVAAIMHGDAELTGDLDLLWDGDPEHAPALVSAFTAVGADLSDDHGNAVGLDAAAFAMPKVLFATPAASGDCCTPRLPWGGLDVAGFIERAAVARDAAGFDVRYLNLEDLITMREAVGRPKDLRRAASLRRLRGSERGF